MAVAPVHILVSQPTDPAASGRLRLGRDQPHHAHPRHRGWRIAALSLALSLIIASLGYVLRPRMAAELAEVMPTSWIKLASEQTQAQLDREVLQRSKASATRTEALAARFAALAIPVNDPPPYRLLFRAGGRGGALTYALPDGSIVVTDELLAMFHNDDDVLALLCDELGHLRYRHMLRAAIDHDFIMIGLTTLLGHENLAVPRLSQAFLDADLSLSAAHEAETFARTMLEENGIAFVRLQNALLRIQALHASLPTPLRALRSPIGESF